jgi:molecular chaperone GrpE
MTTEREDEEMPSDAATANASANAEDPETLRALLEDERQKAQTYMQNWQRAAADYQNFKRRVEEERSENARFAQAALIINLLPIIDDFDRALETVDASLAGLTWVHGIELIRRKFHVLLDMSGVEEIAADGETFDPTVHEAVAQQPGEDHKVLSVVQKGYKLGDRVVRPAMVIVGNGESGGEDE